MFFDFKVFCGEDKEVEFTCEIANVLSSPFTAIFDIEQGCVQVRLDMFGVMG